MRARGANRPHILWSRGWGHETKVLGGYLEISSAHLKINAVHLTKNIANISYYIWHVFTTATMTHFWLPHGHAPLREYWKPRRMSNCSLKSSLCPAHANAKQKKTKERDCLRCFRYRCVTTEVFNFCCIRKQQKWTTVEQYANIGIHIECRKVNKIGIHKTYASTENRNRQRPFASVWVQV